MSVEKDILSVAESSRLTELEGIVSRGLETFVEVGTALAEIRDSKLHRVQYWNFESYCKDRWKISASRARQLIGASERARHVATVTNVTPIREAVTRPLTKLSKEQQPVAWEKAVEKAGGEQPTARQVEEAVVEVLEPECIPPMRGKPAFNYRPALGMEIANRALLQLETIIEADTERLNALLKVAAWCASEIIGEKDKSERAMTHMCLMTYLSTIKKGKAK